MVFLSSETRRYTSYGKRRVNGGSSTATRHAQWLEMMGKPAANSHANDDNNDDDDPVPALPPPPSSSAFITPRELPDQNKAALAKDSQRQRVISLSSSETGSSSSSDVHIIPAEPARKPIARAKKLRVVESPVSSPPSSKREHVGVLKARRPALMARKDSNNIPLSSSPIKKGKEPAEVPKKKVSEAHTVEEKENSRPKAQAAPPKPVEPWPAVISTLSYVTPNVPLHSTPARPSAAQRKSSAASTSSSSYLLSRPMALPPPRGHGQHADVAWRRPLTPLVHSDRYGVNNNIRRPKQQEKQVKEKPKRPPREREPLSPIAPTRRPAAVVKPKRKSIIEVVIPRSRTASPQAASDKSSSQPKKDNIFGRKSAGDAVIDLLQESEDDVSIHIVHANEAAAKLPQSVETECTSSTPPSLDTSDDGKEAQTVVPKDIKPLLQACSPYSDRIHDFSSIIDTFPLLPSNDKAAIWTKLGEATYSEVFVVSSPTNSEEEGTTDEIVVKVIPIHMPSSSIDGKEHQESEHNIPQTSLIQDVVREVEITKLLSKSASSSVGQSTSGFTHLRGAYLASGHYPASLLSAWDDFSKAHPQKGENARPDVFPVTQLYLLLCLSHGGTDLESFRVKNWVQACSILHQVATSLSSAERETQFEHRDLHWGNILIKPLDQPEDLAAAETEGTLPECLRTATRDVQATVIDFTLSRATLEDGRILSGGLEDDALFDGEGDQQYECYRIMRRLTKGDWQAYCPITNVVWLQYIALKLLNDKKLKKPVRKAGGPRARLQATRAVSHTNTPTKLRPGKATTTSSATDFEAEKAAYDSLKAALAILSASIEAALTAIEGVNGAGKPKRRSRAAKTSASSQENDDGVSAQVCTNAGDFVLWWTHA